MNRAVTDQMGRELIFPFPPKRIISLVPSQTELLFDLGLNEEIVGITKFCVHPIKQWKTRPKVGGTKKIHFDKIASLQPDLIIGNKEENDREAIELLEKKYPVWMSDINTMNDALDMIGQVGELTGKKENAQALASKITSAFSRLSHFKEKKERPTVAFFIWRKPYMIAAGGTFINNMLEEAGFRNIFSDKTRYPEITLREVTNRKPDILMLSSEPYPFSEKHIPEFNEECRKSTIMVVNGECFSWYGSRLLEAANYFPKLHTSFQKR